MQFQCPECKAILDSNEVSEGMVVVCPECGASIECHEYLRKVRLRKVENSGTATENHEGQSGSIHSKVTSAIGIETLKGFKLSELFAEVFSKHSREEVEDYFTTGTAKSTPDILDVDASWPKPWLFMRMAITSLIIFFLFWAGWKQFSNSNLLPGLMMVGSFAIPISTLVLFMELNVRRNVSLYMVARLAFLGGILSLLITLVIDNLGSWGLLPNYGFFSWMGASSAAPMEETAKVLAMVVVARAAKYRYKLNGLLVGAAVGVGFAAFESMGYALNFFTDGTIGGTIETITTEQSKDLEVAKNLGVLQGADAMLDVVIVRGILSPLGHIVWSAIAGCALWRVIKGQEFKWRMLCDEKFIRLLLVPVILHMVWNSPFQLPLYGKYILVGSVGWYVCLSLVQEGLHEIAVEQTGARGQKEGHGTEEGTEDITKGGGAVSDALFKCPYCGQVFNGLKEDSGAEAECPSCGKVFTLEALDGTPKNLPNAFMCYIGIFKKYFGFKGRMRRREFWWAFFFWWVAYLVSSLVDFIIFREPNWCTGIIVLGTFIPFAAAQVRRLHDTNKSGWWIPLILLCPINIAYFVWLASDGDKGPNRFGSDPKGR